MGVLPCLLFQPAVPEHAQVPRDERYLTLHKNIKVLFRYNGIPHVLGVA